MIDMKLLKDSALCEMVKKGDSLAFDELSVRYIPLIKYEIDSYLHLGLEFDDLLQEGLLGLLSAARTYDFKEDTKFSTYADVCIKRRFISIYRSFTSKKNVPLGKMVYFDDDLSELNDRLTSESKDANPEKIIINKEEYLLLKNRMKEILSDLEFRVLLLYVTGETYDGIARKLSIDTKTVSNALQRIRKKGKIID